jgi:FtsZ-binding cell division protein ZapB
MADELDVAHSDSKYLRLKYDNKLLSECNKALGEERDALLRENKKLKRQAGKLKRRGEG